MMQFESLSPLPNRLMFHAGAGAVSSGLNLSPPANKSAASTSTHAIDDEQPFEFATEGEKGCMLKNVKEPDTILKPVRNNEFNFYEKTYATVPLIQQFAPKYYGFQKKNGRTYVKLEDLTAPFDRSCLMDLKMGVTTAGEADSQEKKESRKRKDGATTSLSLGMRFCGVWLYQSDKQEYLVKDKTWGKKLHQNEYLEALDLYFSNQGRNSFEKRLCILNELLPKLETILDWHENTPTLRLYSSSLLFVYEGNDEIDYRCDLRMIDFSNVYPVNDGRKDEGYIKGLKNLIHFFEELREMYLTQPHSTM